MTTRPADPRQRYAQAMKLAAAGRTDEARAAFVALLLERPDAPEVHFQLSRLAHDAGDLAARARHLARARAARPEEPALIEAGIDAFAATGDHEAALAAHDARIRHAKNRLHAETDKGLYLQRAGRFDEAEAHFRRLIERHPFEGVLYRVLFATIAVTADDPLMDRLRKLLNNSRPGDESRLNAHFAMAKALEDQGAFDQVFAHLDRANRLQRRLAPYDPTVPETEAAAIRAAQDNADLSSIGTAHPPRAVFVTGMPRSGTTLAERVIGRHPGATPGGELGHALRLVWQAFVPQGRPVPLHAVSEADLERLGRAYARALRRDTGATAGVVTDKSIQPHLVYGYLARALPEARFAVIHRDPRDIAVSIYKNHFATGTHRYGNDLGDIARAIKAFRASVAFWRDLLGDRLSEHRYEDLVSDPEPEARRLLTAAGLDWDPACLDTGAAGGTVRTLSVAQARQPIHARSRAAWRRYEAELAPFFDAWGDDSWD